MTLLRCMFFSTNIYEFSKPQMLQWELVILKMILTTKSGFTLVVQWSIWWILFARHALLAEVNDSISFCEYVEKWLLNCLVLVLDDESRFLDVVVEVSGLMLFCGSLCFFLDNRHIQITGKLVIPEKLQCVHKHLTILIWNFCIGALLFLAAHSQSCKP